MFVNSEPSAALQLSKGMRWLKAAGVRRESRNGAVLVAPTPVLSILKNPYRRVILGGARAANPFFHMMESLWMLAGRQDLPWLAHYNKRMAEYSDDGGETQPGAYGFRWRNFFLYDQLAIIIDMLKKDRYSRRAVLAMWDAGVGRAGAPYPENAEDALIGDLNVAIWGGKDVPCNTHAYFDTHGDRLNMTVCCRSNDIWWGAHGANVVHFSFLLEYVALSTGLPMGELRQFSNDYHLYTDVIPEDRIMPVAVAVDNEDSEYNVPDYTLPMLINAETIDALNSDLTNFMGTPHLYDHAATVFFRKTVGPMWAAWEAHKKGDYSHAREFVRQIPAGDWRIACTQWLDRVAAKKGN